MKKFKYIILGLSVSMFTACVDDYQDANPARPLDAPAGFLSSEPSGDFVKSTETDGTSYLYVRPEDEVIFSVAVVDAPGLVAEASATLANSIQPEDLGVITVDVSGALGKEGGAVNWTYQAGPVDGVETVILSITDAQSTAKTVQFVVAEGIRIVEPTLDGADCFSNVDLVGFYNTVSSGFDSETGTDYTGLEAVVEFRINAGGVNHPGYYRLTDGSFGLYPLQGFSNNFINVEVCGNDILNANEEFEDLFSGTIGANGLITINWSNSFGDTGTTVMTPQ